MHLQQAGSPTIQGIASVSGVADALRLRSAWQRLVGFPLRLVIATWHAGAPSGGSWAADHLGDMRGQDPGGDVAQLMQQGGPQLRLGVDHLRGQLHACRVPTHPAQSIISNLPRTADCIQACGCTCAVPTCRSFWSSWQTLQPSVHAIEGGVRFITASRQVSRLLPWLGERVGWGLPPEVGGASCRLKMRAPGDVQVSWQAPIKHSGIESARHSTSHCAAVRLLHYSCSGHKGLRPHVCDTP